MAITTKQSFRKAARDIEEFAEGMEGATGPALFRIGQEIMTDVKASRPGKGVPRDVGTLAASGTVIATPQGEVVLAFGGPAAPYALRQHEDLTLNHEVGEARYLVRGVERWEPDGSAAIQALKAQARFLAAKAGST